MKAILNATVHMMQHFGSIAQQKEADRMEAERIAAEQAAAVEKIPPWSEHSKVQSGDAGPRSSGTSW